MGIVELRRTAKPTRGRRVKTSVKEKTRGPATINASVAKQAPAHPVVAPPTDRGQDNVEARPRAKPTRGLRVKTRAKEKTRGPTTTNASVANERRRIQLLRPRRIVVRTMWRQ